MILRNPNKIYTIILIIKYRLAQVCVMEQDISYEFININLFVCYI